MTAEQNCTLDEKQKQTNYLFKKHKYLISYFIQIKIIIKYTNYTNHTNKTIWVPTWYNKFKHIHTIQFE